MNKIFDALFPMFSNCRDNKVLRNKLSGINEQDGRHEIQGRLPFIENSDRITTEVLREQYNDTLMVKERLESKAKENIVGVTISITLILGAADILNTIAEKFSQGSLLWISFILFAFSVAYMLIGGILAIGVLISENKIYVVDLGDYTSSDNDLRSAYDINTQYNIAQNLIRNNYIFTSYECIRNALICLFIILLLSTFPLGAHEADSNNTYIARRESSQGYTFMFSPETISFLDDNSILTDVEDSILFALSSNEPIASEAVGIIDETQSVYIKFVAHDKIIDVLLVEPYITP